MPKRKAKKGLIAREYKRVEKYRVYVIGENRKDQLIDRYRDRIRFDRKADIHGMCVNLLTDNHEFKEMWEDNFGFMSDTVRAHCRIIAINTKRNIGFKVEYEPISKTVFILNGDYYGYVKSIALAAAADFLEDYHSIYSRFSVHGSCIDCGGQGVGIIAASGTGKTTLSYGLLLNGKSRRLVSDDWFYVKLSGNNVIASFSEKNSYIRDDIGEVWKVFKPLVKSAKLDKQKRAVVNIRDIVGDEKVGLSTNLKHVFILERNDKDPTNIRKLKHIGAIDIMLKNDFFNPHQLIRNRRKIKLREMFFRHLFQKTEVYLLNTAHEGPHESLARIEKVLK